MPYIAAVSTIFDVFSFLQCYHLSKDRGLKRNEINILSQKYNYLKGGIGCAKNP